MKNLRSSLGFWNRSLTLKKRRGKPLVIFLYEYGQIRGPTSNVVWWEGKKCLNHHATDWTNKKKGTNKEADRLSDFAESVLPFVYWSKIFISLLLIDFIMHMYYVEKKWGVSLLRLRSGLIFNRWIVLRY